DELDRDELFRSDSVSKTGNRDLPADAFEVVARQKRLDEANTAGGRRTHEAGHERRRDTLAELLGGGLLPVEGAEGRVDVDDRPARRAQQDEEAGDTDGTTQSYRKHAHTRPRSSTSS